ncbi:hypothetical protein A7K91_14190 [Paenibacillus oryzae]|uniref:Uncharacterized protein n=1 Tax=Paenibacillus oryzae TaxID=1844972 RepID=A0A1A5YJC0_9BACL|nr:hypothetical protein [Paenibacillus oryzae]OBR65711.1 hypothetical protein A7K91_14190 [Paenibacillus oryzae]
MKRRYAGALACLAVIATAIGLYMSQEKITDADLRVMLNAWDNKEISDNQKNKTINALMDFISREPGISSDRLKELSSSINVFEIEGIKIVEYLENPEIYGSSSKASYHFILYNGVVEKFDHNGSMQIDDVVERTNDVCYVYATDYRVSNITGIQMFSIAITKDNKVELTSLISQQQMESAFVYDDKTEILYRHDDHIYFEEIRNNGSEVLINTGDSDFILVLDDEGKYTIHQISAVH